MSPGRKLELIPAQTDKRRRHVAANHFSSNSYPSPSPLNIRAVEVLIVVSAHAGWLNLFAELYRDSDSERDAVEYLAKTYIIVELTIVVCKEAVPI